MFRTFQRTQIIWTDNNLLVKTENYIDRDIRIKGIVRCTGRRHMPGNVFIEMFEARERNLVGIFLISWHLSVLDNLFHGRLPLNECYF